MTKLTFLQHILALFMMSLMQVVRHRKTVLMAVFSQLSNVCGGDGWVGVVMMLDQRLTDSKTAECVLGVPFL